MKLYTFLLSCFTITALLLLSSCKKDDSTSTGSGSSTSNEVPLGKNFPARTASYFPANEDGHFWEYEGPSLSYRTETTGEQEVVDGESWYVLTTNGVKSYYRYENGRYIVQLYSAYEDKNHDLLLIDMTKNVGESWHGATTIGNAWSKNEYTFEMVAKGTSITVNGINYDDVITVMLTTEGYEKFSTGSYQKYSTIEQLSYYAKGIGLISQSSDYTPVVIDLIDSDLIPATSAKRVLVTSLPDTKAVSIPSPVYQP